MKILFLNPNLRGEFRLNIGLAYLISYIKNKSSHKIELLDMTFHRINWQKYVNKKVKVFNPDILAVSALTYNYYDSIQILNYIKQRWPNIFVIYGGIHPSTDPERTLRNKYIDVVCIGEGEIPLEKLLERLDKKQNFEGIEGIWFKDRKKIIKNPPSHFIEDLDSLPFLDWSFFEIEKYEIVNPYEISMLGSRGCPYNCTYCINPVLRQLQHGKYVRFRSPENIIKEIKFQLKKLNKPYLKYLYFWDDMFTLNNVFVNNFCTQFIHNKLNKITTWSCSSRIDTISEESCKILLKANLNLTRIGIEAGNYHIRKDVYCKDFTTSTIIKNMSLCSKYQIKTQTDFIIGGPKETERNILQSFTLMRLINPSQVSINIYQPYPMIKSNEIFLADGGKILINEWPHIIDFFKNSPIIHNRIKKTKLLSLANKMRIYFLKSIFLKYLREQKIRFIYDIIKFCCYLKWKYNLLWHDLFKITIRKYIYEENLPSKKVLY